MTTRRSSRVPKHSFRMPAQMHSLFFDEDSGNRKRKLPKNFTQLHSNPMVYRVDNFFSQTELEYFEDMCTNYCDNFKASFTGADDGKEIISDERTSRFMYLTKSQDKFVRSIERKSSNLVGLNPQNVEPLQIVSYSPGQYFNLHHDAGTLLEDGTISSMIAPRRLITIFVYLNSMPKGQGHTDFPRLDLSVQPQRNSALLFCNCIKDAGVPNPEVVHCAQPVTEDSPCDCTRKWGVNIWLTDTDLTELTFAKNRTPHVPLPKQVKSKDCDMRKKRRWESAHEVVTMQSAEDASGVLFLAEYAYKQHQLKIRAERVVTACRDNEPSSWDDGESIGLESRSSHVSLNKGQEKLASISLNHPVTGEPLVKRHNESEKGVRADHKRIVNEEVHQPR